MSCERELVSAERRTELNYIIAASWKANGTETEWVRGRTVDNNQ